MKKILGLVLMLMVTTTAVFAIEDAAAPVQKGRVKKQKQKYVTPVQEQEMTLGLVQRDIRIGASMADVAEVLGSPNIVTRDSDGKDTWIYDKTTRITSYDNSGFYATIILVGYNKDKAHAQTSQKTLTVVIKYDKNSKVESFTYHMSKF